jgi:hypothetical protein
VANKNAENVISACRQFGVALTSHALATKATFPMVGVPNFERRVQALKNIIKTNVVSYLPIVRTAEDRIKYENFTLMNGPASVEESQAAGGKPVNTSGMLPFLFEFEQDEQGNITLFPAGDTAPWIPLYHISPPWENAGIINWNIGAYPWNQRDLAFMDKTKQPVMTEIFDLNAFVSEDQRTDDPTSVYNQPIMTNFSDDAQVGAVLQTILPWNFYFEKLLPEGTETIYAVVRNDCNQNFTYAIEGPDAIFLGEENLHESGYDYMRKTVLIEAFQAQEGLDLCSYSIEVSPSKALEDHYKTKMPIVFTVGVLVIFAFTSFVFVMYDCLVQRRQDKVMDSATKTDAIVSSLFPTQFRDQLFEENKENMAQNEQNVWKNKKKAVSFQMPEAEGNVADQVVSVDFPELVTAKPIADLFPATTIMVRSRELSEANLSS